MSGNLFGRFLLTICVENVPVEFQISCRTSRMPSQSIMDHICVWFLVLLGFCAAQYNTCPKGSATRVQSVFGQSRYVQRGVWHLLSCPALRRNEDIKGVIWYKGESLDDPSKKRLVSLYSGEVIPGRERFGIRSDFSLVIQGVDDMDGGRYLCEVVTASLGDRIGEVDIRVIGDSFPAHTSAASSMAIFQRRRRQTLPCECASQTPDVVYWSTGEGVTTDTRIIDARFSDGATLQIQNGADYSIGSDASLTVNSLNDVKNMQTFWCHVFRSDGTLINCNINALMSDEVESPYALMASERSFYLRKDMQQILPCLSWTPGDTACEREWSKLDNLDRQLLSYNLSTGVVDSSPEFDLASDFGLMIRSVDDDHAGVYRCAVGDDNPTDFEVRVIGDRFPLDNGIAIEGVNVKLKPGSTHFLECSALSDISVTTKATLFWSYGATDAQKTTVIGKLNLVPDGSEMVFDLGENDCFGISTEGALLLNNCFQDGDVRYWCHVFPANDDLIRSYVDVLIEDSNSDPKTVNAVALAVCVPLAVIGPVVVCLILKWLQRPSHRAEDTERGGYEPVAKLHLEKLSKEIKAYVSSKLRRIPITPWIDGDDACFASIDTVYRPLEMFANVSHKDETVKYHLDSDSEIFDDGIPELASKHAIIQGRRGCGKTMFLHRMIHDWAMGRERALWGVDQIVVLVPAWLLIKAKTIGEAVVKMLPKNANISAESINAHYARDKSNLTILVDDCEDNADIDAVMEMADNEFLGCQLVLTTRNAYMAKRASTIHNMRHVTITGFTLTNAIDYINVVLDAVEDRQKATSEHKAGKSKADLKSGAISDTNIEQHLSNPDVSPNMSIPPESKESTAIPEETEAPETPKKEKKRKLHQYLEEGILHSDSSCLPAVLVALCQLSIWTKGDAFNLDNAVANCFLRLVECMFERMKGAEVAVTEENKLTGDQQNLLKELGRVVYQKMFSSSENYADFSKYDFLHSSGKREDFLKAAINVRLIRPLQLESQVESKEQRTDVVFTEVISSEIEQRRRCKQGQQSENKPDRMRRDTELTPLISPQNERVCFVLEILEQLCVGVFLAHNRGKVKTCFEDIADNGHREIFLRFPNVLQWAIQDNQFDREAVVDYCMKEIDRKYNRVTTIGDLLQLQKRVELCLQLNFMGQCKGALNKKLNAIFPDRRVCLIGMSSYKLRLLSYLLEHAQPGDRGNLNVKSVELLRIGQYDWSELQEYIEYFLPGQKGPDKVSSTGKTEDSPTAATGYQEATDPASQENITQSPELSASLRYSAECEQDHTANQEVRSSKPEPQPDADNQAKSETGQTTAVDQRNDIEYFPVKRAQLTDQSQSNIQLSPNPHQQADNEEISVPTFQITDPRNEPQSPAPDVKVCNETACSSISQIAPGNAPDITQNKNETSHSPGTQHRVLQPISVDRQLFDPEGGDNESYYSLSSFSQPTDDGSSKYEYILSPSCDEKNDEVQRAVLKKLRERITSRPKDMPKFPFYEPDIKILATVRFFCLQELVESQAGECHLSGAAKNLSLFLPRLEKLESLVLVGTILSSKAICHLAKGAPQLQDLTKLDLRLNMKFDDRAFVAVTNLLLRQCRKLTDLRLSLYGVSDKGFEKVQENIEKGAAHSWGRLKTLYLLHGSPAETFVGFLSKSLKYFDVVERFHISATGNEEIIQDSILEQFEQNMKDPKIMPNLENLEIGNMEAVKQRLASLKLPKSRDLTWGKKTTTYPG